MWILHIEVLPFFNKGRNALTGLLMQEEKIFRSDFRLVRRFSFPKIFSYSAAQR